MSEQYTKLVKHKFIKKHIWKLWYWIVSYTDKSSEVKFMNYGFAGGKVPALLPGDEQERYPLQLYDYLVSGVDLAGKKVLEVGCGRGGGSHYIARYYKPEMYTAMDISSKAVRYCRSQYKEPNLMHIQGDAQHLPFPSGSFDVVINVESSHCYPDISRFYREVARVLKPGGLFLYTDLRNQGNIQHFHECLNKAAFVKERDEIITSNVLEALDKDSARREDLVERIAPKFLKETACTFAGVRNSPTYQKFVTGWFVYFMYTLRKKD